jgi:hypothetical protein
MTAAVRDVFTEGAGFTPATEGRIVITDASRSRALPESILAKIDGKAAPPAEPAKDAPAAEPAKIEAKPDPSVSNSDASAPGSDGAKPAEAAADPAKEAEPAKDAPPATAPDALAEATARAERVAAHNAKLLVELEAARGKPASRSKLDDAADGYIDDHYAAVRHLIARGLGIDDPEDAAVTAELAALTSDLTSKVFGVSLDTTQQAARDAAKARQALARDKRTRKAESDAAAKGDQATAEASKAEQAATFIGNRLSTKDYPLLHALSADLDGLPPAQLVWKVIDHASRTGEIDPSKMPDDQLIAHAAKKIETHYQALAGKIGKASPSPSTAQPAPAAEPVAATSASQGATQSHGGRKLTAADSSAAPATPPSAPPRSPPKPKTRAEFLAQRFPDD